MTGLLDLPFEVITRCAQCLWAPRPADLVRLACTCAHLKTIVTPVIYHRFDCGGSSHPLDAVLAAYVRSLAGNTRLLDHTRTIDLSNWTWPATHPLWSRLDLDTAGLVRSPHTLGHFLCSRAGKLRHFHVEYPVEASFLNFVSSSIEKLHVRPSGNSWLPGLDEEPGHYPLEGLLKVGFLPYVLTWPNLTELRLEATSIFADLSLTSNTNWVEKSSHVTDLHLRLGNFTAEAMLILLRAPASLRSMVYLPPTAEDVSEPWSPGSYAENLPTTSMILSTLREYQAASIRELVIGRAGSTWHENYDSVSSLTSFVALKHLQIDVTMLIGWRHCMHMQEKLLMINMPALCLSPWTLGSLLPPNLQELSLVMDKWPIGQDGPNVMNCIALSIAAELRTGRMRGLGHLRFMASKCDYCHHCFPLESSQSGMMFQNDAATESLQVLREARGVLGQFGCRLSWAAAAP